MVVEVISLHILFMKGTGIAASLLASCWVLMEEYKYFGYIAAMSKYGATWCVVTGC